MWVLGVAAGVVAVGVVAIVYLAVILAKTDQLTNELEYYGRCAEERVRFHRSLRRHAALLRPVLILLSRMSPFSFSKASFTVDGVTGPSGTCDASSFQTGRDYQPTEHDVFVVTQMRSGTTWMQHLVYQVLHRGNGDLVGSGQALYAVSPWLESRKSVPVVGAPLLGAERPSKIIKTHFSVGWCP